MVSALVNNGTRNPNTSLAAEDFSVYAGANES